ncbi:MAG: hypothetical protein JSS09_06565 [Verrucomicrobia bacterium]|nr:hypothetical protein [Verrucomicrobiota bacterium]
METAGIILQRRKEQLRDIQDRDSYQRMIQHINGLLGALTDDIVRRGYTYTNIIGSCREKVFDQIKEFFLTQSISITMQDIGRDAIEPTMINCCNLLIKW